jgi:hypothetical protein
MTLDNIPGKKIFNQRDVRETPFSKLTGGAAVPVGTILPWAKTLTGTPALPDGYVQCDGQVLSDGDSVYNGQTIPDLNGGNRFLRGNSTSGTTGGSATNSTNLRINASYTGNSSGSGEYGYVPGNTLQLRGAGGSNFDRVGADTDTFNILPPYFNIVWIMRIK